MSYQTALLLKTTADQVRPRSWDSMRQASCAFLRSLRNAILMSVCLVAGMPLCHAHEPDGFPVDFVRDIKPILDKNCDRCHGPKKQESGLRLDDRRNLLQGGDHGKPAIVAGDSNESFLIELISGKNADLRMPPKGAMLSELQIQRIRDWIDQGASMPAQNSLPSETAESDLWSFRPLEPTSPPKMSDPWIKNPIDAFVLAKLRERGLKPASPTDARTMIRRVHLVVSGLPPTQEQIQHWNVGATPQDSLSDDQIAELSKIVLNSPRYGERWAQHWLDVIRWAETTGFETNSARPNAWPYRDWLISSLNDDKPFDRFLFEQIAGDTVGQDAAIGFLTAGPANLPGQIGRDEFSMRQARQDELDEVIRTVSQAFLGLTIGCARCHAHKFDPITQQDYYSMQAIFAGLRYGDRRMRGAENDRWSAQAPQAAKQISELDAELQLARKTLGLRRPIANIQHEPFAPMLAKTIRMEIRASNNSQPASIYEIEVWTDAAEPINVALAESGTKVSASGFALENQSRHPDNLIDGTVDPRQAYPWKADKAGPAWLQIDLPRAQNIAKIVWQKGYSAPADYEIKIQLPDQTWKTVAHSADRMPRADDTRQAKDMSLVTQNGDPIPQKETAELVALMTRLRAARSEHARLIAGPQVYGASFGKPDEIWLLRRGDAMQRAKKVGPAIPESLGDLSLSQDLPESKRRAALATFLGSTSNPLVARVIVNRIWQHVFGNGIVETSSDFGRMGSQPSHPLLLDWLAVEFVQNGWSLKHIHRLILNSNTFRQSSRPHAASLATDAESRLLWRFPPRRLDAESLRDSILQVSGKLNPKMGGPGFDFFNQKGGLSDYIAKETFDANGWRRMIYSTRIRMQAVDIFGAFDCPDSGQMRPNRPRSITPIQALSMLNSPFVNRQANFMAERVLTVAGNQLDHQVSLAVELVFSRRPTEEEKSMLSELARVHGMGQVCRVLINSNEFLFLR